MRKQNVQLCASFALERNINKYIFVKIAEPVSNARRGIVSYLLSARAHREAENSLRERERKKENAHKEDSGRNDKFHLLISFLKAQFAFSTTTTITIAIASGLSCYYFRSERRTLTPLFVGHV